MERFARLYRALDRTTSTLAMIEAMSGYFREAPPEDAAWAVFLLIGERLRSPVKRANLATWAREEAGLEAWLFEESHSSVGDLAETIALCLDTAGVTRTAGDQGTDHEDDDTRPAPLHVWMTSRIRSLAAVDEAAQRTRLVAWWRAMSAAEVFVLVKLMTGTLRVGVSRRLVVRALAALSDADAAAIEHRLMGAWQPTAEAFAALFDEQGSAIDLSRPYPFFLASPLEADPATALGEPDEWRAEWKFDGIRGQLIRRAGEVFLWSRGEELVGEQFPEIQEAAQAALEDGTVLDGEILAWRDGAPLPFAELQRRLGRKTVGRKLREEVPVHFIAWDVLEQQGQDLREVPLEARRERLEALLERAGHPRLVLSPRVEGDTWEALAAVRAESRERRVEGLMLKRVGSPYRVGRVRGDWWKWKIEPYTLDMVLIYAQPGSGRRASLLTDYTFGVWDDDGQTLVPLAKAYMGLSNEEIRELDAWIRRNTVERFGPVRSVSPQHVFELSFEDIRVSTRHKSGIAVRFPRIARWRRDKGGRDANTLADARALITSDAPSDDEDGAAQ